MGDLARIALTDEEITRLQGDLNVIAESINKVQEVATDDVEPTANPVPLEAYLRPDVPETPLTQAEPPQAPRSPEAGMFVAPRILGQEDMSTTELRQGRRREQAPRIGVMKFPARSQGPAHPRPTNPPNPERQGLPKGLRRTAAPGTGRRLRRQVR